MAKSTGKVTIKKYANRRLYDTESSTYITLDGLAHMVREGREFEVVDAKSGEVALFQTPTPKSAPRRGNMDAQDRLWFGEFRADRIGMFDTKSKEFREWKLGTRWSAPYDVVLDRNEFAWTGSMVTDQVERLDPATGQITEYLLPHHTNIRRVFLDNSVNPPILWVGNNHGAAIVRIEPLD